MGLKTSLSAVMCLLLMLVACSDGTDHRIKKLNPYTANELWLCKPGAASNRCLELDQTITNIYSDTSQAVFEHTPAVDPGFDCFYVYPTVDLREEPGNTEDLTDDEPVLEFFLYNQAARFTQLCDLYAPLYHQMTIGTYDLGDYRSTEYFAIAFDDVNEAFSQYLRESDDRHFVLMGHSQGAQLLHELLLQRFEDDPKLQKRLISALLVGPLELLIDSEGITFADDSNNIPFCAHATQTACIIAYDTIAAGGLEDRSGEPRPCVNPTLLGGEPGVLENTIWQTNNGMPFPETVETPWVGYPGLHSAHCEADGWLGIDTLTEEREPPVSPQVLQLVLPPDNFFGNTLHIVDFNWAIGDLLRVVSTQAESMP